MIDGNEVYGASSWEREMYEEKEPGVCSPETHSKHLESSRPALKRRILKGAGQHHGYRGVE